jgi:hypothetical protein
LKVRSRSDALPSKTGPTDHAARSIYSDLTPSQ